MKLRKVNTASENRDTFKHTNIHVIGVPEVRRKRGERKNIWRKLKDLPNLLENVNLYLQETQQIPNRINTKRSTPRHITVKVLKDKEKILETARKKKKGLSHVKGLRYDKQLDLILRSKIMIKPLEENMGINLYDLRKYNSFLDKKPKYKQQEKNYINWRS